MPTISDLSTPHGKNHIGTITLCLPSSFSGGELVVKHNGSVVTYNWGPEILTPTSHSIAWAFLYSDCEHEVLPVKSGYRITLAYDIFTTTEAPVTDSRTEPIARRLADLISSPAFFPEGVTLGFGFIHDYPTQDKWEGDGRVLKGLDSLLYDTLLQLRRKYKLKLEWSFAYDSDLELEEMIADGYLDRDYGRIPATVEHNFKYPDLISNRQYALENEYIGEDSEPKGIILVKSGARIRDDVIWLTAPKQFTKTGAYTAYGNNVGTVICRSLTAGSNGILLHRSMHARACTTSG